MTKRILGSNNNLISQLKEVIDVKGHLWKKPSWRVDRGDLDEIHVNFLLDDLVQLLSGR